MIRKIIKGEMIFNHKARKATIHDLPIGIDLLDTLKHNQEYCVGMAGNMIGEDVAIIVFQNQKDYKIMYNPEIIKKSDPYYDHESCLSLKGQREVKRYKNIKVKYQDEQFKNRIHSYDGFVAQIIQHEIDHLDGIII